MKNIDGKESNTTKRLNVETRFNEFKDTLFNKKVVRHKMKKFKAKNVKLEHMKSTKYHYHVLMMAFTHLLKTSNNRFSQMIINKKRLSKMVINNKKFSQIKIVLTNKKRFCQMRRGSDK